MYKPPVTFVLNERCKELDVIYTEYFFTKPDKSGSFEKKERLIKQYPLLKKYAQENSKNVLVEIITELHSQHQQDLELAKKQAEKLWKEKEGSFLSLCEKVFEGNSFPEGDYICYLSVLDINTLIKKERSFQLYCGTVTQGISNTVIAHEMLHFIFYNYMEKFGNLDKKKLWEFAEIFNKYLQNSNDFSGFEYPEEKILDAACESRLRALRKQLFNETVAISEFIKVYNSKYSLF